MKKYFSFIVAVATMFSVASCSQEEVVGNVSGNEVEVTFNATMEGQAVSRAIGDGLTVDELYFAVYDEAGNEIGNLRQDGYHGNAVPVSELGATVKVRLVKGQTYQFVFWAQKSGAADYNTSDMKAIKVNDYTTLSNDESRDAFYAYVGATKVTGPFSQDVTLKRPFAQLNLGTTAEDWGWAETAGVTISDSKVKVTGEVYSTLNTFDGTVAGEVTAEFALNAIPSQGDLLVTEGNSYYYLSTNYLLAPAEKSLSDEIVFTLNAGTKEINTLKVYNAPLQRNWRTNIVGEILTGEGTFNITIDPIFDGDHNYGMKDSESFIVENANDFSAALAESDANIINFEDKVVNVGEGYEINRDVILNFNNHELNAGSTPTSYWYALEIKGENNVIINDANFTRAGIFAGEGANVVFNSGLINHKPERTSRYIFCAQSEATITVNAGTFTNDRAKNSYFWADNATIIVNGGNFGGVASNNKVVCTNGGQVIIKGGTFNFDPTAWVADGYKAEKIGSTWTVSAE